jgi:hypothetical protein
MQIDVDEFSNHPSWKISRIGVSAYRRPSAAMEGRE